MVKPKSRYEKREEGLEAIKKPLSFLGYDLSTHENMKEFTTNCIAIIACGQTVKENLGVPENILEYIYSLGYAFYQQARYKKSAQVFTLLSLLNHKNPKYTFSLGANYQMMGDFKTSARFYELSYIMSPDDPSPIFRLSECALKMDKSEVGQKLLEMTIELCGSQKKHSELKKRSEIILDELER